ncbi:MAG: hypothetical protein AAF772_00740 [Acidobacteriota bacterium]
MDAPRVDDRYIESSSPPLLPDVSAGAPAIDDFGTDAPARPALMPGDAGLGDVLTSLGVLPPEPQPVRLRGRAYHLSDVDADRGELVLRRDGRRSTLRLPLRALEAGLQVRLDTDPLGLYHLQDGGDDAGWQATLIHADGTPMAGAASRRVDPREVMASYAAELDDILGDD